MKARQPCDEDTRVIRLFLRPYIQNDKTSLRDHWAGVARLRYSSLSRIEWDAHYRVGTRVYPGGHETTPAEVYL